MIAPPSMAVAQMTGTVLRCRGVDSRIVWRALWAIMFAGHAPAWIAAIVGGALVDHDSSLFRALVLTLTQLFFVLKLLDPPWLRFRASRRTCIGLVAAVVLLHGGVLQQTASDPFTSADAWRAVLVAGGLSVLAFCLARRLRSLERVRHGTIRCRLHAAAIRARDGTLRAWSLPRYLLLTRVCSMDRTPPH